MKTLIIALLLGTTTSVDMVKVRKLFSIAATSEEANEELMNLTKGYTLDYAPVLFAYYGGALTTMANHSLWPSTKIDYFNRGKYKIEQAVEAYPDQVEIRFVRFCVQKECPFFLDYADDLPSDKAFILKNLSKTDWSAEYKEEVKLFMNS